MTAGPQAELRTAKSEWRTARRLYAVYSGVISQFDLGIDPCPEIECPIERRDPATRARVKAWLNQMDSHCPVAFLRRVLQSGSVGNAGNLFALIRRHLDRPYKTEIDRDKLDFLLVQYFANCVPQETSPTGLTLAEVGRALQPILGKWPAQTPHWMKELDAVVEDVGKCHCMQDLADHRILERGRELKALAGARFFEPQPLIAFTRYNIILRRAFFYTMRADLDAVRLNAAKLQRLGVKWIDATRAGLSDHESLASVHKVCVQWRSIFRTDYSSGHVFRSIKELRACTEKALEVTRRKQTEEHLRRRAERLARQKAAAGRPAIDEESPLGLDVEVALSDVTDVEMESMLSALEEPPQNTVDRAYPELTVDADPVEGTPARFKVPEVMEKIHAQVSTAVANEAQALSVGLLNSVIRLAWWEHEAFKSPGEENHPTRASVAARLILQEAFDDFQDGLGDELEVALAIAHGEAGSIQERIAEACDARETDQIVAMSASAQRLLELIREAEFAWNEENE